MPRFRDAAGTFHVSVSAGADGISELRRFDFQTGRPEAEPVVSTPGFDFTDSLVSEEDSGRAFGLRVVTDAQTTVWFDPALAANGTGAPMHTSWPHGTRLREALRAAGREPEYAVYQDEGHGWLRLENQVGGARRLERFLAQHLQRQADARGARRLPRMRGSFGLGALPVLLTGLSVPPAQICPRRYPVPLRLAVFPLLMALVPWVAIGEARAQGAKAEPVKAESPEAAASAAMERAQRMAANPMRVIMQASKIRRRPGEPEPPAEPARPAVRTAVAVAAPPAAAPRVQAPAQSAARQQLPATPAASLASAAAPSVAAAAPAVVAAATAEPLPAELLPSQGAEAAQTAAARPVPASAAAALVAAPAPVVMPPTAAPAAAGPAPGGGAATAANAANAAVSSPSPPAVAAPAAALNGAVLSSQPKLVSMVEPDIPARVLLDGPRVTEVVAELSLGVDGRVMSVSLISSVPRAWQRYLIGALERWRFEPLPAPRVHRVQLVFSE